MSAVMHDEAPPPLAWNEIVFQRALTVALACLGFFLLFSTAGTSLAVFALLVLCALAPVRLWRLRPWREPVLATGLLLLGWLVLRTVVEHGLDRATVGSLNRYHELLLLPLLWALMRMARKPQAFTNGLMAGALLFAALHWLAPYVDPVHSFMESRRISAGFGLAVCAYLIFEHARLGRLPRAAGIAASLFLAGTVIFGVEGRTGHVVLLILLSCAAFRAAPARLRLPTALGILVVGLLIAATSGSVRERVFETVADVSAGLRGERLHNSSTNTRLEIWRNGAAVAQEHWLVGTGTQHYPAVLREAAVQRHGDAALPGAASENPHNEYLMQLGAGGLPALLLFLAWLAIPMWRGLQERRGDRPWAGAVACVTMAFAVAAVFNSVLLDFVEGHFYTALLAWLLVRRVQD